MHAEIYYCANLITISNEIIKKTQNNCIIRFLNSDFIQINVKIKNFLCFNIYQNLLKSDSKTFKGYEIKKKSVRNVGCPSFP